MPKSHTTYDAAFRQSAVDLLLRSARPLKRVAADLGVSANALRDWRDLALGKGRGARGRRCGWFFPGADRHARSSRAILSIAGSNAPLTKRNLGRVSLAITRYKVVHPTTSISKQMHHNAKRAHNRPLNDIADLMTTPYLRFSRLLSSPRGPGGSSRRLESAGVAILACVSAFVCTTASAETGAQLGAVKSYLVQQVGKLDAAAHDFQANAEAYQKIIDANGGDYDKASTASGPEILGLVKKMQGDYLNLHMNGYETIEGIAAGVRELVAYDIYFDSGVPKSQGSTDTPVAPVVVRDASGKTIVDRDGNLFHFVIEPCPVRSQSRVRRETQPPPPPRLSASNTCRAPTSCSPHRKTRSVRAIFSWPRATLGSPG